MNDLQAEWEAFMLDIGYDKQPDGSYINAIDGDAINGDVITAAQARIERSEFLTTKLAMLRDGIAPQEGLS